MRLSLVLSILPLAISVGALNVTEPTKGDDLDVTDSFTVKWSSVNTDPSTVDIVLINNHIYPNFEKTLASGIDTSKGSYTASGIKGVTHGSGFQINLMSTSKENTGILAQSQQFEVTEPAKSSSEASTTATGKTTATESATSTTKASGNTSLTTSASSTTQSADSTTSASTSASPIHSEGAGIALAAPGAAAGLLAGLLAFNL